MPSQVNSQLEEVAGLLKDSIQKIFLKEGVFPFEDQVKIEKRHIIEYERRMRASSVDKFNAPAYTAAANFFRTAADRQSQNAVGVIILSLKEGSEIIIKRAGIQGFDEDDHAVVSEKSAELCAKIGNGFKGALAAAGFPSLILSEPVHHRNNLSQGVEFPYDQYEEFLISFQLKGQPALVVELSMANLPRN